MVAGAVDFPSHGDVQAQSPEQYLSLLLVEKQYDPPPSHVEKTQAPPRGSR